VLGKQDYFLDTTDPSENLSFVSTHPPLSDDSLLQFRDFVGIFFEIGILLKFLHLFFTHGGCRWKQAAKSDLWTTRKT